VEFRVWSLRLGGLGIGYRISDIGYSIQGLEFGI
jgi:hypothetical protein